MKEKRKTSRLAILGTLMALFAAAIVVVLIIRMEGEKPSVQLEMDSPSIGAQKTFTLRVGDEKSGVRQVWAAILKDGKETVLVDKTYPAGGFLEGGSVHADAVSVQFDTRDGEIKDGKAMLRLVVRDYSWRQWGKGNQHYEEHPVIIDTKPPVIEVLSRTHNLTQGGAGLVVYKLSEQCPVSGVKVGEHFYPGMTGLSDDPDVYATFIALDYRQGSKTAIHVTAKDFAGNEGRSGLVYHINGRRFKKDKIPIPDQFLDWKMPEFRSQVGAGADASPLEVFLKVNRDLRRANYETLVKAIDGKSQNKMLWKGAFVRLPRSANRAGFADNRSYFHNGKKIDEQTHLGVDLASIHQAPVPASNAGRIVFAESLGIYGGTIVMDHGFGLFSMYSHLSHLDVSVGQSVDKEAIIGKTGRTGLAGGDHLHFSMLVHYTFVNPLEWWDAQWLQNNILSKLETTD